MEKRADVLLVIPTYNEAGNIERLLTEIHRQELPLDVLVVDDNSPDGTGEIAERLAELLPLQVIHRAGKLGIGSAHKRGFTEAIARGYPYVMTMDADFAHAPCYLEKMLAKAGTVDVVVGSRYIQGGGLMEWNLMRRLITHTAHWLTRHVLKLPYDCTGGFRLYKVSSLQRIDFAGVQADGYAFLMELLWHMQRQRFSIAEIPIVISFRNQGASKISRNEIFKAVATLVRLRLQPVGKRRALATPQQPAASPLTEEECLKV
ncbi:MAG: dolichyl-phosphate beta-D-mannosyltransferase [Candidatus Omnitrophica bacterium CG11_big_fil_rev_8_21_14_0_20_63_9]|nr:MAG: dolichyl-phosphate beta-D-mannosyltransferase [Candidatus Omnitrophica bacterium CG11_big_fil_rev_8_21_14_0_20_63_9]